MKQVSSMLRNGKKKLQHCSHILSITTLVFAILPTVAKAQTDPVTLGEQLENLGRLYKNDDNDFIQEAWVLGRYHGAYHWSQGSDGRDDSYETRRMRMGGQVRMFKKLTLHAQMLNGTDVNPFYNGFTELWGKWEFSPEFALTVGQQKNRFTHDRVVSSRYMNYMERNLITNQFNVEYTPGVTAQGTIKNFSYYTGVFTNATGTNIGEAFSDFDSGYSALAAVYYDLGARFGVDNATVAASYLHSDANQNATNMNRFDNGISSSLILTKGSGSLVTEVTGGFGSDLGNVVGLSIQPGFFLTDTLQAVTRYQLAGSNDSEGLVPQKRYERSAGIPSGDLYQATYVGLNYYIAKHRLKFMNGVEYSSLGGQDVWTFSTMVRFFFGPQTNGAFPSNQMRPGYWDCD